MKRFHTKPLIVEAEYAKEGQHYYTADGFKLFAAGTPLVKRVFDGKAFFEAWTAAEFEEIFEYEGDVAQEATPVVESVETEDFMHPDLAAVVAKANQPHPVALSPNPDGTESLVPPPQ